MDVVNKIKNWVSFRSMITPIILKVVYQLCFIVLNVVGIIALFGIPLMTVMSGLAFKNNEALMLSIISAIVIFAGVLIVLIIYNIFLRMYFELIMVIFNIYGELKEINNNTKKNTS